MADIHLEMTAQAADVEDSLVEETFNLGRILRLSSFHIGSAMGDILLAGVWNRIVISDFGIPAWPVGLLIALKNFMAPISIWIGHRSDTRTLLGWHRTSYIWLGRSLMLMSLPLLGFSTVRLEADTGDPLGWLIALLTFVSYGLGTLLSGSPYLALVRDSAPQRKQGLAIAIVESVLIGLFPVVAIIFSRLLVTYNQALFWRLLLVIFAVGGFFWFFAVAGVEKKNGPPSGREPGQRPVHFQRTMSAIWSDNRTRGFFVFLFLATLAAWMQDNVLEPFGADVFRLNVEQTTRFTSYWGTPTLIVLLASFFIWRRKRPELLSGVASVGLGIMGLGMLTLLASGLTAGQGTLLAGLVIFGFGFGLYSFGGLSLMAVMSPSPHSGAYLGLWTVAVLVSRGLGIFLGGVSRDVWLALEMAPGLAYGLTFAIAACGLWAAALILGRLDIPSFARDSAQVENQD